MQFDHGPTHGHLNWFAFCGAACRQDVRFSLIPYRDHALSNTYCTKVYPFTRDLKQMLKNVNEQSASGGGDTPEAVTAALFEGVVQDWREDAAKLLIFMADAGPHGLGEGHEQPNGDPDGKDPLVLARYVDPSTSPFTRRQRAHSACMH